MNVDHTPGPGGAPSWWISRCPFCTPWSNPRNSWRRGRCVCHGLVRLNRQQVSPLGPTLDGRPHRGIIFQPSIDSGARTFYFIDVDIVESVWFLLAVAVAAFFCFY